MKKAFPKLTAAFLSVLMLVSMLPAFSASAAVAGGKFENAELDIVTDKASTLANGVTQNAYTVYDKKGDQVKMYVTTADMNVDTVKLYASYKDMNPKSFGMSKLTEQVASFNAKVTAGDGYYQGTAVAGINASYYNMTTGQPMGIFVMNGVVGNASDNQAGYFAVMKDGSVKIGVKGDYAKDKGNIQEAIGIYTMLIVDGEICSGLDASQKYPRQTIGITADNKVILMTADGNQAPSTIGLTVQEQAQVMLDLGCVWAGHLDGGGSATYACKPEGSDKFVITNSPSDGSERSVSNGFIIASTEAASYTFDHAVFNVKDEYVTPGTSTEVSIISGVSSTGNPADVPEGITYEVTNGTYADGIFTAGNDAKDAIITAMYNGKAAGSATVHVVIPDEIKFNSSQITVPYNKTVGIGLVATYGLNKVTMKPEDVNITLSDATVGTVDGFNFTAGAEGVAATESNITAELVFNGSVTASSKIKLGKSSEVLFDFEDGKTSNFKLTNSNYNYYLPNSKVSVADSTTGKVHSGNYALALNIDYSNSLETGYQMIALQMPLASKTLNNAKRVGMWIYIPDENVSLWSRWKVEADGKTATGQDMDGIVDVGKTGYVYTFEESGWHYLSIDVSTYKRVVLRGVAKIIEFYISDRDGTQYGYYFKDQNNMNGNFTFYVDDITVDYSDAVEDREAPVFSELNYGTAAMSDAIAIAKNSVPTINNNIVDFAAKVAENTAKDNATGLNISTAKAYVDGNEVACTYAGGSISINDSVVLADGEKKGRGPKRSGRGQAVDQSEKKGVAEEVPHPGGGDRAA